MGGKKKNKKVKTETKKEEKVDVEQPTNEEIKEEEEPIFYSATEGPD
jgi:hypothetical protein